MQRRAWLGFQGQWWEQQRTLKTGSWARELLERRGVKGRPPMGKELWKPVGKDLKGTIPEREAWMKSYNQHHARSRPRAIGATHRKGHLPDPGAAPQSP